jgi:DNA-binding CsgD family transcriptional regulator
MSYMIKDTDYAKNGLFTVNLSDYLLLPIHVYFKDSKGIIKLCNDTQAKSLGYEHGDDVVGSTDSDFLKMKEAAELRKNDLDIIKTGKPKTMVEIASLASIYPRPFFSIKMPFKNQMGKVIGLLGLSFALDDPKVFSSQSIPPALLNIASPALTDQSAPLIKNLTITKREKECLQYLTQGMTAKEIAKVLELSPRTIEFYIENMKKKFGCVKRTELIVKAFDCLK